MSMELNLTPEEKSELFGDFAPEEYAAEAEQRWGGTDAWRESAARTASFTKQDWARFTAEAGDISSRLAAAMRAGLPASSEQAMDLAEEHRAHITRWCYQCGYELHRGLGEMYVSDPRFTATIDRAAPGLAAYYRDAIAANATRNGA
ncbi:TipAS antibiotic-recognition domain-containing protein [Nonomuraea sp. LPB2021202275-12-8]|uniref:TipAS antibiotic-recognition domain-containing protein n=1 Tax=Nonomuraea sp. LPB2021202275-12-8 TaxID=3120159 RepID=UPI00300C0614